MAVSSTPQGVDVQILPGTLSLAETAKQLGIGVATAYDLVHRGEFPIPVTMIGRRMKILRSDLDRFLAGKADAQ